MSLSTMYKPTTMPAALLKLEALSLLIGSIALYIQQGGGAVSFVLLLFAPDLSMLGYIRNPAFGSILYNAFHTYTMPALLTVVSLVVGFSPGIQIALIWFAHIGMDRTIGYGLKYATHFKDTHLNRI